MKMYIAGHGHALHLNKPFVAWMKKHATHFLVSFAYPDMSRLNFAKQVRDEKKKVGKKK
jgi:hypothetical protein